ncbi:hypothetical protein D9M73_79360 [compost metagenome]|jgi:hypothetical protein
MVDIKLFCAVAQISWYGYPSLGLSTTIIEASAWPRRSAPELGLKGNQSPLYKAAV